MCQPFATEDEITLASPTFAEPAGVICAYDISDHYGPISRYLYYSLLLASIFFHRVEWLVGGTLGACMLFSSIAAVHATALYSVQGGDIVDLDITPAFAITVVGMLAAAPMFIWSKTLREAATYVRILLSAWVVLMMAGVIASCGSISQWPTPHPCDEGSISGSCILACNGTLLMRERQPVLIVSSPSKHILSELSSLILSCGLPGALLSWVHLFQGLRTNQEMFPNVYFPCSTNGLRRWGLLLILCIAWASVLFSCGLIVAQIVITEAIMYHLPMGESMSAIGQWGPAVGAVLALFGSLLKGLWKDSSSSKERNQDLESFRDKVFQEGAWWGQGAEGLRMGCGSKGWVVRDGVLRRQDDLQITEVSAIDSHLVNENHGAR